MKPNSKDNPISGKVKITHYECIKDGKVLLSSDDGIEVESIEEFKKNAHKLIVCDEVKVEYKAEENGANQSRKNRSVKQRIRQDANSSCAF